MPKPGTPKFCWHRGKGLFYVRLDGQQVYLGDDRRTALAEYDRLVGEWLANGRRRSPGAGGSIDLTVAELIGHYRRYAEGYYCREDGTPTGHVERTIKPALRELRRIYGHTPAIDFRPLALQSLRQQMVEAGLSRGVVNTRVQIIRQMFKWAVAQEMLPPSVYQALAAVVGLKAGRSAAREPQPVLPIDDVTVEATLPHLPAVVADMVRLQRLTGMRPDEVCRLRPADVDRTGDVWTYRPGQHKTQHHGRERVVFIGPKAQVVLRPYLLRDGESVCFVPAESEAKRRAEQHARRKTPLCCGNRPGSNRKRKPKRSAGLRYDANSYRRAIHRACDKADRQAKADAAERGEHVDAEVRLVERWSPNRLRHTAATEIRKRFGLEAAQVALGHSNANVTQIYAERDLAKGVEVARIVG